MKRAIVVVLLAGLTVNAQTFVPTYVDLQFTPGLTYEGSDIAFDESEIEMYHLYCDGAYVRDFPNDFTRTHRVSVDDLGAGSHSCGLSETVGGLESIVGNSLSFDLGQRQPTAPTLTVVVPGAQ